MTSRPRSRICCDLLVRGLTGWQPIPGIARTQLVCIESMIHDPEADGRPKKITKLYVAGPMSGYEDCNYPLFSKVAAELGEKYEVANPAKVRYGRYHYVDLIRDDLRLMLDCHGVAVLDYWWESVGARNEVNVAGILKMPVRPWKEWLDA